MSDFETVREFLGYIDYREHQDGNPWEALRMIEDRLRDAEERAAVKEPFDYIESLESRLSAAEKEAELYGTKNDEMMSTWLHPDVADELEAKLKQAEAVVEAVKEALEYGRDGGTTQSIYEEALDALRQYEEAKK